MNNMLWNIFIFVGPIALLLLLVWYLRRRSKTRARRADEPMFERNQEVETEVETSTPADDQTSRQIPRRRKVGFRLGWFLASSTSWCDILWIVTLASFIFAVYMGPGKPILTETIQEEISFLGQVNPDQNPVYDAWNGPAKARAEAAAEKRSKPIQSGSGLLPDRSTLLWSWWPQLLFMLLLIFTFGFSLWAHREQAIDAAREAHAKITEKTGTVDIDLEKSKEPGTLDKIGEKLDWKRFFSIEMVAQFVWNFFRKIIGGRI